MIGVIAAVLAASTSPQCSLAAAATSIETIQRFSQALNSLTVSPAGRSQRAQARPRIERPGPTPTRPTAAAGGCVQSRRLLSGQAMSVARSTRRGVKSRNRSLTFQPARPIEGSVWFRHSATGDFLLAPSGNPIGGAFIPTDTFPTLWVSILRRDLSGPTASRIVKQRRCGIWQGPRR